MILSPPFETRLEYVLRHASNLHDIEFVLDDELNPDNLFSALKSLTRLTRTPRVSFDRRPNTDGEHPALGRVIQQFKNKLTIVKLDAKASPADLQYVAGFHQLERLNVYATSEFRGLRRFLNGIPLIKLTVVVQGDDLISSLPPKLRILRLYLFGSTMFHETWSAVCGLKHLEELIIRCSGVELEDGPPCRFNSSNLRTFELSVDNTSDVDLARQILSPVLENSSPSVVEVDLDNLESAVLPPIFTKSYALSSLVISSDSHTYDEFNSYTFEDLLAGVKNAPRLENAQLPWPTVNGEGETTPRLSYTHAQELANAWPNLDEIEFRLSPCLNQNQYSSWSGFDSFTLKIPENMPFDRQKLQFPFWRLSHWALLQSFKMDKFMDDASPCLNLCTLFFKFGDENYPDTTPGDGGQNISVFLSLKQVRRHAGHLYSFCLNKAESSCGKGCRLLLEGLTSQSVKAKCRSRSCTMLESSYHEACGVL